MIIRDKPELEGSNKRTIRCRQLEQTSRYRDWHSTPLIDLTNSLKLIHMGRDSRRYGTVRPVRTDDPVINGAFARALAWIFHIFLPNLTSSEPKLSKHLFCLGVISSYNLSVVLVATEDCDCPCVLPVLDCCDHFWVLGLYVRCNHVER